MLYNFKTIGTCSKEIHFEVENDIVKNVEFKSGCDGNLQAIARLIEGMKIDEVIEKLKGIDCKGKETSCSDQLCIALEQTKK